MSSDLSHGMQMWDNFRGPIKLPPCITHGWSAAQTRRRTAGEQRQAQHQMLDNRIEAYAKLEYTFSVQKCGICSESPLIDWLVLVVSQIYPGRSPRGTEQRRPSNWMMITDSWWWRSTDYATAQNFDPLLVWKSPRKSKKGVLSSGSKSLFRAGAGNTLFGSAFRFGGSSKHSGTNRSGNYQISLIRSLISIFWKPRVYLDYAITTDKMGRIELAESSLQIWA